MMKILLPRRNWLLVVVVGRCWSSVGWFDRSIIITFGGGGGGGGDGENDGESVHSVQHCAPQ